MKRTSKPFVSVRILLAWLAIIVGIFGSIELAVRFLYPVEKAEIGGTYSQGFNLLDPNYGYKPKPDSKVSAIRKAFDGTLIYSVHYSTDEFSRRITPMENKEDRDRFIIFFGCSFTFGEGLEDNQTLPFFTGELLPCYEPYNYGYSGYGPQNMLVRLREPNFPSQIKQRKGVMIYSPAHVSRAIGSYKVSTNWGRNLPFFYIDKDGLLRRDGDFQTGRTLRSLLYSGMSRIRLLDIFLSRYDIPHTFSDNDIRLTAKIIEESFKLFNSYFPDSRTYFMLLPGVDDSDQAVAQLLRKAGFQVLDFSSRQEFKIKGFVIKHDGHPTALWNENLARLIVKELRLSKESCPEN